MAHYLERLASFARVITFDKRGTGLSDRELDSPTLEDRMDDIRAVMDATDLKKAALYGFSEGGSMAALFAATYPERCQALILFGALEKFATWLPTEEQFQAVLQYIDNAWGSGGLLDFVAPSLANDGAFREWMARYERLSASPAAAMSIARMNKEIDIRHVLPAIRVPTLVMHRTDDKWINVAGGRYFGAHIPGARYIELPGPDRYRRCGPSSPASSMARPSAMSSSASATRATTRPAPANSPPCSSCTSSRARSDAIAHEHAPDAVGAVGLIESRPNSRNVVPGEVFFTVDFRHPDDKVLDVMEGKFRAALPEILEPMKLSYKEARIWDSPAVKFAPELIACVRAGAEKAGFKSRDMISGAGHDAAYVARVAPTTMIFVPC